MASNKIRASGVTNNVAQMPPMKAPPSPPPDTQDDDTDDLNPDGQATTAPTDPEALMDWFKTATPQDADNLLTELRAGAIDTDGRQQDDDITRFFNRLGWTSDTPDVMSEQQYQQAFQAAGKPAQIYHSDQPFGGVGARQFAQQFMGNGYDANGNQYRHYLSNGYYGNGTYFADSAADSAGYGPSQFRGFLNSNAKVGNYSALDRQLTAFRKQSPAFNRFFSNLTGGYNGTNYHSSDAAISVFAAMSGYNVIHNGCNYYTILNRKVVTMSNKTVKSSYSMSDW